MKDFSSTFASLRSNFEKEFLNIITQSSLKQAPKKFQEAVHYSLFSGGKRIRACILMEISKKNQIHLQKTMLMAAALECLHTYSLVHDDLPAMDDDDFRRDKPSSHKRYDESTAILVGDCLQALSFELLAQSEIPASAMTYFAETVGGYGMVGGQFLDLQQKKEELTKSILEEINFLKTGRLFQAAVVLPIKANTNQNAEPYENWGRDLGLLFQITDDLEDEKEVQKTKKKNTSLNILDCVTKEEVLKMINSLRDSLINEAHHLFSDSIFLKELPDFISNR